MGGWGGGKGWNREKLRDIPICFRRITFITPGNPYHEQNTLLENTDLKKKCRKQNLKCRKTRMSALNYGFLVQPTRMEGKNSYCVVKCVINTIYLSRPQSVILICERGRGAVSPIDPINCLTFDTFLLKICCFAKLDMNRKNGVLR